MLHDMLDGVAAAICEPHLREVASAALVPP
jgi:hypothetical protein